MTTLVTLAPVKQLKSVEHPLGSLLISRAGWMVYVRDVELLYTFYSLSTGSRDSSMFCIVDVGQVVSTLT